MIKKTAFLFTLVLTIILPISLDGQNFYWEDPEVFAGNRSRFPRSDYHENYFGLFWQDFRQTGEKRGEQSFSFALKKSGEAWQILRGFLGPLPYFGEESPVADVSLNEQGIFIAYIKDEQQLGILYSSYEELNFREIQVIPTATDALSPRLFSSQQGMYLLYSQSLETSISIFYVHSLDGRDWSSPEHIVNSQEDLVLNFSPHGVRHQGKDYLVFQSQHSGERITYQLYLKESEDGGRTWSDGRWITDFEEDVPTGEFFPERFTNQRPFLFSNGETLYLTWERRTLQDYTQVYLGEIREGDLAQWEKVTRGVYNSNSPQIFEFQGNQGLLWFDDQRGEFHVKLATKGEFFWNEQDLTLMGGNSVFPRVLLSEDDIYLFWENTTGNRIVLYQMEPDRTVNAPDVRPVNFRSQSRSGQDFYTLLWNLPEDSSGIEGFNYLWTRQKEEEVPQELRFLNTNRRAEFAADEDGLWYFHIKAKDYAGNWSPQVTTEVFRDTTPPAMVSIEPFSYDSQGYLKSNTFGVNWSVEEEYLQGYSYRLNYQGASDREINFSQSGADPGSTINATRGQVRFSNLDNGLYTFKVRAIDSVGNPGPVATTVFRLNKYIPVTYVSYVDVEEDQLGRVSLDIFGRGFAAGGLIENVILDRDGRPPYDYTFSRSRGNFSVASDRQLVNLELEDVEEGNYRIGVQHPGRGIFFTRPLLQVDQSGTVKFGDFSQEQYKLTPFDQDRIVAYADNLLYSVLALFFLLLFGFTFRQILIVPGEERKLAAEMELLVQKGKLSADEKKIRIKEMKQKGLGLRLKFAIWILTLVIIVLLMVSLALGFYMTSNQQRNLAEALVDQTEVLLTGFSESASNYLPSESALELNLIPKQISAMEDALFAVITGPGSEDKGNTNYVWGVSDSNHPILLENIDTPELAQGISRYEDEIAEDLVTLAEGINTEGQEELQDITAEIDRLTAEASRYTGTDAESTRLRQEILDAQFELVTLRNNVLDRLAQYTGIYPEFNPAEADLTVPAYLFYKPITYARRGENTYYRGTVRVWVSTDRINQQIITSRNLLIQITGIIALVALGLGIIGALTLSAITVNPIKRLVQGVEKIRDTDDKSDLRNHKIDVHTRDELELLAETINQMTKGLVKAADASKELTVGKEVQKMFIPLDADESGRKMTTGGDSNQYADFFGYYEGAKGVSGDYFDYMKLDQEHYALIKCDVAGKGVPAALIMVEVATIFLNHFRDYKPGGRINLPPLVYRMNDLLEERGFKGRFAAFNLGILNIRTGEAYFCHAGDKTIHGWDAAKGQSFQEHMPETPAAGVFPSMIVEMQNGFTQEKFVLNHGDMLFFFTDGLEEAQRHLRNKNFAIEVCENTDHQKDDPGISTSIGREYFEDFDQDQQSIVTHLAGKDTEEFSIGRLHQVINAVMNRKTFTLYKSHNPLGEDSPLDFDFSQCRGSIQEAVLAMVSLEKVFRLYPDPTATAEDKIRIDSQIDDFLKKHFRQYDEYFGYPIAATDLKEYRYYSNIKEDEQYDDLTILGIQRK